MRRVVVAFLATLVTLLGISTVVAAGQAAAQTREAPARATRERGSRNAQEARRLYESGSRAFQEGRFEAALRYFEQAYQIAPRSELLYNIGRAAEEAQAADRAIVAYRQYLAETQAVGEDGNADTRHEEVAGRLTVLEAPATQPQTTPTTVVAATETTNESMLVDRAPHPDASHSVTDEGWFWPVVLGGAALLAGGVVLAVVLTSNGNGVPTGDDGVSAEALRAAPLVRF